MGCLKNREMFKKRLSNINSYKPGKPIEEVKRELEVDEVYKLASNEIPFSPTYINKAIQKELKNINRYPETGCFYLRRAVAKKLKVRENSIVFGNGSDEIITLALRALIEDGDEVLVAYPTFLIYEIQARIEGAKIIRVPLKDFRYCLDDIANKVTSRTKLIFIANPDNPTGTYLTNKEVKAFLDKIPSSVVVFFDEAYFEFAPADFPKSIRFLNERGNIIVARTFSKAYGLAGARIGYGITTPDIAAVLNKVREPFNVNRFAQVAAAAAVNNDEFLDKVITHVKREKQFLYKELSKIGIEFIRSATNFILIDFKKDTGCLNQYLLENGIIIRELKGWGLPNLFRVTVGLCKENKKFIDLLKRYVNSI
ncbi:MAG: histidinol-phosphate transaminase [Candidatus Omnitrophica bacterium]|nr:histidinol-phosphate transaminase [Candidatus Omnitrophota bacterium]